MVVFRVALVFCSLAGAYCCLLHCCTLFAMQIDGETHVLHTEEATQGTRLVVDTLSCLIAKEADPSRIIAQVRTREGTGLTTIV